MFLVLGSNFQEQVWVHRVLPEVDNPDTRGERREQGKFAPAREVWDSFIANCGRLYVPRVNLTVDEQRLGCRGKCSFRMYIPNKPAKYGIKLVLICDSETKYMLDSEAKYMLGAIPYLGKQRQCRWIGQSRALLYPRINQALHGTNRNVTIGSHLFLSLQTCYDLCWHCSSQQEGNSSRNDGELVVQVPFSIQRRWRWFPTSQIPSRTKKKTATPVVSAYPSGE